MQLVLLLICPLEVSILAMLNLSLDAIETTEEYMWVGFG
jgi:hypothetical protein